MKKILLIITLLAITVALTSLSLAIDPDAGTIDGTLGPNTTRSSGTATTVIATGGNITQANFSMEQQTSFWSGFYGNISQSPVLEGGTNNFYTWSGSVSYTSGFVIFSNESTIDWGNLLNATATQREAEDSALGLTGEADSVNNTFTLTNTASLNISDVIFPAGGSVSVNTTSSGGSDWETVMIRETTSSLALYAAIVNPGNNNYAGSPVDYQAMIPTDGTQRTYYVYVGLE